MSQRNPATITPRQVAEYFLAHQNEGERISNLKLQKLCYYAQGFSLGLRGTPLFMEPVRAWNHGPVIESVWQAFKRYGYHPIPESEIGDETVYTNEIREVLDLVVETYGVQTATTLRNMTHEEPPWREARDLGSQAISNESLRTYFAPRVVQLAVTGGRPRPLEKSSSRAALAADKEFVAAVQRGIADIDAGRAATIDR